MPPDGFPAVYGQITSMLSDVLTWSRPPVLPCFLPVLMVTLMVTNNTLLFRLQKLQNRADFCTKLSFKRVFLPFSHFQSIFLTVCESLNPFIYAGWACIVYLTKCKKIYSRNYCLTKSLVFSTPLWYNYVATLLALYHLEKDSRPPSRREFFSCTLIFPVRSFIMLFDLS